MRNRFSPKGRLFLALFMLIVAAITPIWSAIDGEFGRPFWFGLIFTASFTFWSVTAYLDMRRDELVPADQLSNSRN